MLKIGGTVLGFLPKRAASELGTKFPSFAFMEVSRHW